jgi:acetylornithine deacetylase/succinyl-diaminopimelate desuccinylase-like protein
MSVADDVVGLIKREDVAAFALEICNIDSPYGHEGEVADHIFGWMERGGFNARKLGLFSRRYNVLGTLPGTGGGYSLIFNSHMDTAVPREADMVHANPADPIYHSAWEEDGLLLGEGICNDKGPMAAFLIAAKAVKESGHKLKGDLLVSGAVHETGGEPCDDEPGAYPHAKEIGARYLATHGGIADFALIAEGTGFGMAWVEAGECFLKIALRSDQPPFYTAYLPNRTTIDKSPNMIVASAAAIAAIEDWAAEYQREHVFHCAGGTVVPKAQIGGFESGDRHRPFLCPQLANLYLHVFMPPGHDPLQIKEEISSRISKIGIGNSIEIYSYRPGYEAKNIDPFVAAVERAHRATFNDAPKPPYVEATSMWRDLTVWNELGIPAMTYGPRSTTHQFKRALSIDSLYQAACVYARIAIEVCNTEKPRRSQPK